MHVCMCVCVGLMLWGGKMFDFHRSDVGGVSPGQETKFQNEYPHTIVRHHWQVSGNHIPRVHPRHTREIVSMETVRWLS